MKLNFLIISLLISALVTPTMLNKMLNSKLPEIEEAMEQRSEQPRQDEPKAKSVALEPEEEIYGVESARQDDRGHFSFDAQINGAEVTVLVDTGASAVAINRSTAEEAGIYVDEDAQPFRVNTANGKTTAYQINIDEIAIGEIVVTNVRGFVLEDEALSGTLLGMSFLKKLERFEIEGDTLTLTQ